VIKYNVASLVKDKRPRGSSVILPAITESLSAKRQYLKMLNRMLRGLAKSYRESVAPAYKFHREFAQDEEAWFTSLESEADALEQNVLLGVGGLIAVEAGKHTDKFILVVQRSLDVDLAAIVRNEDLGDYLRDASSRNAALIKSLRDDVVKDIRRIVFQAKIDGRSATSVANELRSRFKIHANRAKLIAEDQINKLTSDLNRIRQQQAGVTRYSWETSGDERVRNLHRGLNGKKYRWGERTGAEGGLAPGQPVRCRCSARPVIVF